ncbi:MAG: ribonuclease HI [Betaproteobacteria bacterium]|nr:ribonuclease HI [Betaproteobacteria bacterium]
MSEEKTVELFTDGACKGNPGPGGWGVLLRFNGVEKTLCGGERETTNNRMELSAVIEGLRALKRACPVRVHTDSRYVMQGITEWMPGWIRKGWRTASGSPVKNQDLWRALAEEVARHRVEWQWVKGHAGHPENERADALANEGVASALRGDR